MQQRYSEPMDVRQLQILRELGELGSVTAVAEALYVTPSAVSQQLRLLQAGIPVPLTQKAGRALALTDAGRALAAAGADVELALARAREAVAGFTDDSGGTVSICAFSSAAAAFFPSLLRADGRCAPGAPEVRVADEDVAQSDFPRLTSRYDLVVAHRLGYTPPWPDRLAVVPLLEEPLDVAVVRDHPLATKRRLTPGDVAGESWIAVHEGFPLESVLTAISAAAGRQIAVTHRVNDFPVVTELVAAGAGVALVPRWTTRLPDEVTLVPLAGVHAERSIDVLARPERAVRAAARTVIATMVRRARQLSRAGGDRDASA